MNVLINGGSGYISYHLICEMLNSGYKVYAVCRNNLGFLKHIESSDLLNIIISEQDRLIDKIKDLKIDVWYQILWEGACGEKRKSPEIQLKNEIMAISAMRNAEAISCKKIVFTGTIYEKLTNSILEMNNFNNSSFYIMAKKHTHEITKQLAKTMNLEYVWVRFCHPIGKYMNENQLIPYAVKSFMKNEETMFGPCNNYFDIISVTDLAAALKIIGENKNLYYIGSGKTQKLRDYLSKAAEICDYTLPIGFGKKNDDGLVFQKEWFDNSDFEKEFNFNMKGYESCVKSLLSEYSCG